MFSHLQTYLGDPILTLYEDFLVDTRVHKANLSIGVYFDDDGNLPLLDAVRQAERQLVDAPMSKHYLPIEGLHSFRRAVQTLLFGDDVEAVSSCRVATIQTIGSCGGLRVGADLLRACLPVAKVWVSDPTWDNHRSIFERAGFEVAVYPYFDRGSGGLRFDAMLEFLDSLPAQSVVLLHACCHNPTGVDPSSAQWQQLIELMARRRLIPFIDLAYQGFGDGLDQDAALVRAMTDAGMNLLVANSFSKNMSVYGERCGALSVVCPDARQAALVLGQIKSIVRQNYSSPPMHAGLLAAEVLGNPVLFDMWVRELDAMRLRILTMRLALHDALHRLLPSRDFGYLLRQRGMFSFTGMTPTQVDALRDEHAVYLVRSGRLCVSGLTHANVDRVASAMAAAFATGPQPTKR